MTAFRLNLMIILACIIISLLSFLVIGEDAEPVGGFFAVVAIVMLSILPAYSRTN